MGAASARRGPLPACSPSSRTPRPSRPRGWGRKGPARSSLSSHRAPRALLPPAASVANPTGFRCSPGGTGDSDHLAPIEMTSLAPSFRANESTAVGVLRLVVERRAVPGEHDYALLARVRVELVRAEARDAVVLDDHLRWKGGRVKRRELLELHLPQRNLASSRRVRVQVSVLGNHRRERDEQDGVLSGWASRLPRAFPTWRTIERQTGLV